MKHFWWTVLTFAAAILNFYFAYRRANDSSEKTVHKAGMTTLFTGQK